MAAEVDQMGESIINLHVNDVSQTNGNSEISENEESDWGFGIKEVYSLAFKFFKEKEGKAIHLSYKDRLRLVALTKQVTHGRYRPDVSPDVGFLDVVGNDRRQAWQGLGEMSTASAMEEFVSHLDRLCPLFKPYLQAHKTEKEEKERLRIEEEQRKLKEMEESHLRQREEEALRQQEEQRQKQLQQEMQIRAALNQQTAVQFRQYAEQQFPGDPQQQEGLIAQLQEQHYQQYMQQVYQQQLLHQQQQYQQLQAMSSSTPSTPAKMPNSAASSPQDNLVSPGPQPASDGGSPGKTAAAAGQVVKAKPAPDSGSGDELYRATMVDSNGHPQEQTSSQQSEDDDVDSDENQLPAVAAASMWTRKDIKEFKDSIRKDPDSVIKIGSGETVTVRVPTHEDGTCLFWEFATDSYDLGFGVYFEWTISPSNQVSVHVSESSDEEELEDEEGGTPGPPSPEKAEDVEKGGDNPKKDNRPPTDEIIPVYRRDSHEEVYCGSHMYPGRGVYLLKFDNSYSLWRSKTLYYRVYYTR